MSTYLVGDIHGCYSSLKKILHKISFNLKKDILWITGDLVSKGPNSLKVLNLIYKIKNNVKIVLGNHDLYLLKLYSNLSHNAHQKQFRTNINILQSFHFNKLITWLRYQPIMQIDEEKKIIMTHAGIHPKWNLCTAKKYAQEIENILRSTQYPMLLNNNNILIKTVYNNNVPNIIKQQNLSRIRVNINIFTRMRYLLPNGELDFKYKDIPEKTPYTLQPWFNVPSSIPPQYSIIFGHWSSLQGQGTPPRIYGLDSGCYQGKKLTLLQWENKKFTYIPCDHNSL